MNRTSRSRSGGRATPTTVKEMDNRSKQTPNTDMQAEDAGTAESGAAGRGSAAEGAMKQTSKTKAERGGQR